MKPFFNPSTAKKYCQLGFSPADLSLRLTVDNVSIHAVEHPYKGVALIFESITPRTMCQYEVSIPERCSVEQIAHDPRKLADKKDLTAAYPGEVWRAGLARRLLITEEMLLMTNVSVANSKAQRKVVCL